MPDGRFLCDGAQNDAKRSPYNKNYPGNVGWFSVTMIARKTDGNTVTGAHLALRVSRSFSVGKKRRLAVVVARRAWKTAPEKNRARRQVQEIIRKKTWDTGDAAITGVVIIRALPLPRATALEREIFSLLRKSGMVAGS